MTKVVLPDETQISLDNIPANYLLLQPERDKTLKHMILEDAILGNVSLIPAIPLALAFDMDLTAFNILDTAIGVGIAGAYGIRQRIMASSGDPSAPPKVTQNRVTKFRQIAGAIYDAVSPLPPLWELFIKAKNMNYKSGAQLSIMMDKALLENTFKICSAHLPPVPAIGDNKISAVPTNQRVKTLMLDDVIY